MRPLVDRESVLSCLCRFGGRGRCPEDYLTCEYCGDRCDSLTTVEDADATVGYRGEIDVCPTCLERIRA
jgi:hypothetical protein